MSRLDWVLLPIMVMGGVAATVVAFRYLGFLGIGILGLLTGLVAVNVDLQRGWPIGPARLNMHADRLGAEERMSRAERAAWLAEIERNRLPIFVAKVASAGLIIFGFGLFVLYQLPG